ncbi:MAG TPA: hypothetical protein VKV25_02990 [Acidimicrobiales bacterium]|nr:hypothetical protein [Acidimicrobiales bacterium]
MAGERGEDFDFDMDLGAIFGVEPPDGDDSDPRRPPVSVEVEPGRSAAVANGHAVVDDGVEAPPADGSNGSGSTGSNGRVAVTAARARVRRSWASSVAAGRRGVRAFPVLTVRRGDREGDPERARRGDREPGLQRARRGVSSVRTWLQTEPQPYTSPGRSALLHWRLVAACTAAALVLGVVGGALNPPTYTATATLYVGKTLSLSNTAAIAGLSTSAASVAQDYARLIATSTVTGGAARRLHRHGLPGTLSATEIPQTPEIQVTGTASSPGTAVRLANAGAQALVADVTSLNVYSTRTLRGLEQTYESLEAQIATDNARINALQDDERGGSASVVAALQRRIVSLRMTVSADQLQAGAVSGQYENDYSPFTAEEQVLQVASPAGSATSDRKKSMEIGLVVGLVAGFLIGVGAATRRDLRLAGRARPAPPAAGPPPGDGPVLAG